MSSLHDQIGQAYSAPALGAFEGEEVTYTPAGDDAVVIMAVVMRDPLQPRQTVGGRVLQYPVEILVNRADVPTVTVGADTVALPIRLGDDAATMTVARIIAQVGGQWRLGLRT